VPQKGYRGGASSNYSPQIARETGYKKRDADDGQPVRESALELTVRHARLRVRSSVALLS
jgi:hypothetical protein